MATGMSRTAMRRSAMGGRHLLRHWAAATIASASLVFPACAGAAAPAEAPIVTVDGGLLTLTVRDVSLRSVLENLSLQAGIEVHVDPRFEDSTITASLRSRPLEPVIRGLLSAYDTFFLYRAPDELQPAALRAVWVLPRGTSDGLTPQLPRPDIAGCSDPARDLQSSDPAQRLRALERIAEVDDDSALRAIEGALRDDVELVRHQAIVKLGERAMTLSDADVMHILSSDPSPLVRQQALENLFEHLGATDVRVRLAAQAALSDGDLTIRQRAQLIVDLCNAPQEPPVAVEGDAATEPIAGEPGDGGSPDGPAGTEFYP